MRGCADGNPRTAQIPTRTVTLGQQVMNLPSPPGSNSAPEEILLLMKASAHVGDVQRMEELLEQVLSAGYEVSLEMLNNCIHTCSQAGDLEGARRYFAWLQADGHQPDLVSYNTVLNACATVGDSDEAHKWVMHMLLQGVQPNQVTFGTICKVFARKGAVSQVEGIMQSIEENDQPLNEYFYATLISACGAADPPDLIRAEQALHELWDRGLRPQSVKRALVRVIGEERTLELFRDFAPRRPYRGGAPRWPASRHAAANRVRPLPEEPGFEDGGSSWARWPASSPNTSPGRANRSDPRQDGVGGAHGRAHGQFQDGCGWPPAQGRSKGSPSSTSSSISSTARCAGNSAFGGQCGSLAATIQSHRRGPGPASRHGAPSFFHSETTGPASSSPGSWSAPLLLSATLLPGLHHPSLPRGDDEGHNGSVTARRPTYLPRFTARRLRHVPETPSIRGEDVQNMGNAFPSSFRSAQMMPAGLATAMARFGVPPSPAPGRDQLRHRFFHQ
mmetsp:Transcript_1377/g.4016  ORF Transcript_1377/g.4016 Transcript_1377/m.4016 type:complete len:503 (-) Transcript_1377:32-1540(-)